MSIIWVPKVKILEPNKAIVRSAQLRGRFKLEAVRPDGRRRPLTDWFDNLITDAGLNAIGTLQSWMSECRVGTGNATPVVGNTALQSQVATTTGIFGSPIQSAQGSAPYYGYGRKVFRFAAGVAAGNLAEIGIADQSAGVLFSRALILDGDGDPTVVTVQSDEFLDATYELRVYPPLVDVTDTITIDSVDYDIVTRAASVTTVQYWNAVGAFSNGCAGGVFAAELWDGTIGAITSAPSGTSSSYSSNASSSYSNNSLFREGNLTWNLAAGNFVGGIDAATWTLGASNGAGGMGRMQCSFSPAIPKTSADILSLVFRHTWARGSI